MSLGLVWIPGMELGFGALKLTLESEVESLVSLGLSLEVTRHPVLVDTLYGLLHLYFFINTHTGVYVYTD